MVRMIGSQRDFAADGFSPKDHVSIGEALDLVDFESAAEVGLFCWTEAMSGGLELCWGRIHAGRARCTGEQCCGFL